ncbi:uncharacterized protein LOC110242788 [Exaiptasia diaphana]|uniref:Uncharacterized protein n=1 Tax=Exaiptasia diaphana TaxID=2652724 RepID=A0A913XHH2_EXADI|nr:uncharacterized protein LOC110242788 [Exaiptasia diaphana]KXJ26055.1 hypothetical protein AC249_AIPGENE6473 [Exaiptasia diaphana]
MSFNARMLDKKKGILPADLAAAYNAYHANKAEEMRLFKTLKILQWQQQIALKTIKKEKAQLEQELKNQAEEYFQCHRVFSEESLISITNSLKKLYMGPFPTKAVLPKGKLYHLKTLLRQMQDELYVPSAARRQAITGWLLIPTFSQNDLNRETVDDTQIEGENNYQKHPNLSTSEKKDFPYKRNAETAQSLRTQSAPARSLNRKHETAKRPKTTIAKRGKGKIEVKKKVESDSIQRPKSSPYFNIYKKNAAKLLTMERARSALTSKQKDKQNAKSLSRKITGEMIGPLEEKCSKENRPRSVSLNLKEHPELPAQIIKVARKLSFKSGLNSDDEDSDNSSSLNEDIALQADETCFHSEPQPKPRCNKGLSPSDDIHHCPRFSHHQAHSTPRKRKVSIFKKTLLAHTLYGKQVVVESDLRQRVMQFMDVSTTDNEQALSNDID